MKAYVTIYDMDGKQFGIAGNNISRHIRIWEIILIAVFGGFIVLSISLLLIVCIKAKIESSTRRKKAT